MKLVVTGRSYTCSAYTFEYSNAPAPCLTLLWHTVTYYSIPHHTIAYFSIPSYHITVSWYTIAYQPCCITGSMCIQMLPHQAIPYHTTIPYYSIPSYHIALSYYSKYVYSNAPAPSRPLNTERLEQSMNGETFATSFLGQNLQHTQIHNPLECAIFSLCSWAKIWIFSPLTVFPKHGQLDFFKTSNSISRLLIDF